MTIAYEKDTVNEVNDDDWQFDERHCKSWQGKRMYQMDT